MWDIGLGLIFAGISAGIPVWQIQQVFSRRMQEKDDAEYKRRIADRKRMNALNEKNVTLLQQIDEQRELLQEFNGIKRKLNSVFVLLHKVTGQTAQQIHTEADALSERHAAWARGEDVLPDI